VHDVLRAGIRVTITPISLLVAVVLRLRAAALDPLGDLAHGGLCDPVYDLYGD
jgi:hypothetical protein